jgi:hypothetical protein
MASGKVFVSPGVYTSERDLTFVTQSVGVTTLGIVGETLQGPAFEPIFIKDYDEFVSVFGNGDKGTSPAKFVDTSIPKYEAAYIAKAYLEESNQLYVTRVLGLSGYDAGPSWSITTIANIDGETISPILAGYPAGLTTFTFTGSTGGTSTIAYTSSIPSFIPGFNLPYINPDGGETTLSEDFANYIYNEISNVSSSSSLSGRTALFFGSISQGAFDTLTGSSYNPLGVNIYDNVLGVANVINTSLDYTSGQNDIWYSSLFSVVGPQFYSGSGFGIVVSAITSTGGGSYSGTVRVYGTLYTGNSYTDYDDVVVATLRSRGVGTYASDNGPVYKVSATTSVGMVGTGVYSGISKDPYSSFLITGTTTDGTNSSFSFDVSMVSSQTNFIAKTLGTTNFNGSLNSDDFPLFVEEAYPTFLSEGYLQNKIRGLNSTLVALPGLRNTPNTNTIAYNLEKYQTPETPFIVSELRGNKVYKLFKLITISDGTNANFRFKITLANIDLDNNTFDVVVRDFNDTDSSQVVLDRFSNCTMDPTSNSYVAKKIGTSNGEFPLRSRYVMIELSEEAPTDAVPAGFEGLVQRSYGSAKPPFLNFKTLYYGPNGLKYSPPFSYFFGGEIRAGASGDRKRNVQLGVSSQLGYDFDQLTYRGKQAPTNLATGEGTEWNYVTKGFHMDSGATVVLIGGNGPTSGESKFFVGESSFQTNPTSTSDPYYGLNARKFTLLFAGGFDGWDIYRKWRTNGDGFALGGTNFLKGYKSDATYPNATGWGAFRRITGPNQEIWANTDYYAYLWGQKTFANPEAVDINIFTTPGIDYFNNSNLVEEAIEMVERDRADSIYICTTADYNLFTTAAINNLNDNLYFPESVVENLEDKGIDSNYTATYYPWILKNDTENNEQVWIPATGEVVKNLAYTDKIFKPWFASAGYTRGVVNAVQARKRLTQDDRDTLYKGRINPIATFTDIGTVIWGNKTLQIRESALDRINVRRLLLQARKLISAVAVRLLFEQNDDKVRQQFLDSVNPILDEIRRERGLIDFRVQVSSAAEDLDSNTMTGKIFLKPTRALEYIDIEFVITPAGASFDDL